MGGFLSVAVVDGKQHDVWFDVLAEALAQWAGPRGR
jgi:hypothetical protein